MTQYEKIWYLKKMKLFGGAHEKEHIDELNKITHHKYFEKHRPIYLPGNRQRKVYLVKTGHVKLSRINPQGKSITLAIIEPGEIFGVIEALEGLPKTSVAESLNTLEPVQLCEIQHQDFEQYLHQFPEIGVRILKLQGKHAIQLESRMEDLAFKRVGSRLANALIHLSKKFGNPSPSGIELRIRLTHQNLADLIGTNRETVTGTLKRFIRAGLIVRQRGITTILDEGQLRQAGQKD